MTISRVQLGLVTVLEQLGLVTVLEQLGLVTVLECPRLLGRFGRLWW